jgi:dipeptide/tripeptide permease
MTEKNKSLKRKVAETGGWMAAKRIGKAIPYVGTAMAIGLVGYDIKRKGTLYGVLNSGLDAIPFVGLGKNVIEFFTGDLLPDKDKREKK